MADRRTAVPGSRSAFAAERLAPHQVPARFVAVDRLPRSVDAKVLKRFLLDRFTSPATVP